MMNKKELAVTIMSQMIWDEDSHFIGLLNETYLPLDFNGAWYDDVANWCKKTLGLDETDFFLARSWWWSNNWSIKYTLQMAQDDLNSFLFWNESDPAVNFLTVNELTERHHKLYVLWLNALPY